MIAARKSSQVVSAAGYHAAKRERLGAPLNGVALGIEGAWRRFSCSDIQPTRPID